MKVIIIGGVAGGATTAARLRRVNKDAEILVFEKGPYISYANCGLTYHISGVIENRENLLLTTPRDMKLRFNIDVKVENEVIQILPNEKKVKIKDLKSNEIYEENYDKLVISTGSTPLKPPIDGINSDRVKTLWTIPDMDNIKKFISDKNVKDAIVVGGGFIGFKMAENLHHLGINVSIVEKNNQLLSNVDFEMAQFVHQNINSYGVNLYLGKGVTKFEDINNGINIFLDDGTIIKSDMVILSIGIKPNSKLAKEAGINLNNRGGIIVDEYLRTNIEDIYAVGDVIEVDHFIDKEKTMIPLAGPANKQGRLLADTISGNLKSYRGTQGTSIVKAFDLVVAGTGLNEKQLTSKGFVLHRDYETVIIQQNSHAGYYPNATPLTIKVMFDKRENILGASIVGMDGVDKRIDVISTVIGLGGKVRDLMNLELAYAPPFSSAKDPVNMVGYVAENIIDGKATFITPKEYDEIKDEVIVLDVRENIEREVDYIENSKHIPYGELRTRYNELDKNKLIIVYCAVGVRAYNSAIILNQKGFTNVKILSGGFGFYKNYKFKVKNEMKNNFVQESKIKEKIFLDCSGLQCPGPILKLSESIKSLKDGEIIKVAASDMGFCSDVESWCKKTNNFVLKKERDGFKNIVYIQKGSLEKSPDKFEIVQKDEGQTIVVFSGDLDKVLASFIIANGAVSLGKQITMFFTFWGLNALRKNQKVNIKKSFLDKMFCTMMPRGSKKLKLSKMNFGGLGTKMMRKVMNDKNVDSLENLMKSAIKNGVRIVALTMSMDVMGIKKEELIDGIEYAGVASYLSDAHDSKVNLFV